MVRALGSRLKVETPNTELRTYCWMESTLTIAHHW